MTANRLRKAIKFGRMALLDYKISKATIILECSTDEIIDQQIIVREKRPHKRIHRNTVN